MKMRGFTLIEIIIAISLIAVFVTLPVLAYSSYLKKTRDIQRKTDINKIQSALEQYRANTGGYPDKDTWEDVLVAQGYLPSIPTDPKEGQPVPGETGTFYGFEYEPSSDGQSYHLSALLEQNEPGGVPGIANELSYYVVSPEGPKVVHITPGPSGGALATFTPAPSSSVYPTAYHSPTPTLTPTLTPSLTPTITPSPTTAPSPTPGGIWTRTINSASKATTITSGKRTSDAGLVVAGSVGIGISGGDNTDGLIAKWDGYGTKVWSTTVGVPVAGHVVDDVINSIQQTSDGGYIAAGATYDNTVGKTAILVVKLNSVGTVTWSKKLWTGYMDNAFVIKQTSDLGYIIGGTTDAINVGSYDAYLIKLDSSGNFTWAKGISKVANHERFVDVAQTADGYIGVGAISSDPYFQNAYTLLVKTDTSGNVTWSKQMGSLYGDGSGRYKTILPTFTAGVQNGYILAANVYNSGIRGYIAKLNLTGGITWDTDVYYGSQQAFGNLTIASDGGYVVAGNAWDGGLTGVISKFTSGGAISWTKFYPLSSYVFFVDEATNGNLYVFGTGSPGKVLSIPATPAVACGLTNPVATIYTAPVNYSVAAGVAATTGSNTVTTVTVSQGSYSGESIVNVCN